MKKKLAVTVSIILIMSLLSGCGVLNTVSALTDAYFRGTFGMPRFEDYEYIRPDMDELNGIYDKVISAIEGSEGYTALTDRLDELYAYSYDFNTMYYTAYIRSYLDTTDKFYASELAWCDEAYNELMRVFDNAYYACAASEYGEELDGNYFWEGFAEEYADPNESIYTDRYVELMNEEARIQNSYRELIADPVIEFRGETVHFNDVIDELYVDHFYEVFTAFYKAYNEDAADILISLVDVRRQLAEELEYAGYGQMMFDWLFGGSYTPEDAEEYIKSIEKDIIPLYKQLREQDYSSELSYYSLDSDELSELLRLAVGDMGGIFNRTFSYMDMFGLMELSRSPLKANTSFEIFLDNYNAPFLFADTVGDSEDVITAAHEFGHCVDAFVNWGSSSCTDLTECFSQSMELLLPKHLDRWMNDEFIDDTMRVCLFDKLCEYAEQSMYTSFEFELYSHSPEELSAETINGIMLDAAKSFGVYSDEQEEYYSMLWIDIPHFFTSPMYVISYPVSLDVAMQIYALELDCPGDGADRLEALMSTGNSELLAAVEAAELESPFSEGRTEKVAELLRKRLT